MKKHEIKVSKWAHVSILNAISFKDMEFIEMILEGFNETDMIKFIFESLTIPFYSDVILSFLEAIKTLIWYGEHC